MIENKLDVTELPVAESVKDGDQLLLVRTQKNGVKVPMRMESQKLTKQKKQQIVIGRAIQPRACEIGGVENWYVFGRASWHKLHLLLNIASMLSFNIGSPDLGYDMVVLNITNQRTRKVYVFKHKAYIYNNDKFRYEFFANKDSAQTFGWFGCFFYEDGLANAFRVDSYDLTERVLTLNLTHKCLQTTDLRGTSTYHYFKNGVRRWHVSKSTIAKMAFYDRAGIWNGRYVHSFGQYDRVVYPRYILLKKECSQQPHINRNLASNGYRGVCNVVSYSKVEYQEDKEICSINNRISKRRPYGKYKIWALQGLYHRRKSDEYLHCRMKCVGLGAIKDVGLQGPHFDRYRVTVREI